VDVAERRTRLAQRQLRAASPEDAARRVVALHATDPASVFLSVLARCPALSPDDVARALYEDRALVRMMGMRRTLFVVPRDLVPVVHAAASVDVAAAARRRLLRELTTLPTDPALPDDVDGWLGALEAEVERTLARLGAATGAELAAAVPGLRTALLPTTAKAYDVRRAVTSPVLTLLGAQGRLVRGRPAGGWTSRRHVWEPASAWWPDGVEELEPARARALLVQEYVRRFGPVTEADVVWWTGWSKGTTRAVLAAVGPVEADGLLVLPDDAEPQEPAAGPSAVLLPALDPTPMGWKQRDWFLPADSGELYDAYGNVGPTAWWDGEVVGGWAVRPDGEVVAALIVDRGQEARAAVEAAAGALQARLGGTVVVPSFRTPLERRLSAA
jgi:hypothetical protein